jgi:DNA polymerase I-like protein with 3'-5' exonuclease and polymerase domains
MSKLFEAVYRLQELSSDQFAQVITKRVGQDSLEQRDIAKLQAEAPNLQNIAKRSEDSGLTVGSKTASPPADPQTSAKMATAFVLDSSKKAATATSNPMLVQQFLTTGTASKIMKNVAKAAAQGVAASKVRSDNWKSGGVADNKNRNLQMTTALASSDADEATKLVDEYWPEGSGGPRADPVNAGVATRANGQAFSQADAARALSKKFARAGWGA